MKTADSSQKSTAFSDTASADCPKPGITGSTLKLIAVITMLIDHIGATVLYRLILHSGYSSADRDVLQRWTEKHFLLYYGYYAARLIGRLAFPIFCFLLVEGFLHTHSRRQYALRLFVFALISEVPFDLAFYGQWFYRGYQNVFFTLLIGLLLLCAFAYLERHMQNFFAGIAAWIAGIALAAWYGPRFAAAPVRSLLHMFTQKSFSDTALQTILCLLSALLAASASVYLFHTRGILQSQIFCAELGALCIAAAFADALKTDYSGVGVILTALLYLLREDRFRSMLAGCLLLTVKNSFELPCFAALFPTAKYSGSRGLSLKYAFYVFYPAHLLILYLICMLAGIM